MSAVPEDSTTPPFNRPPLKTVSTWTVFQRPADYPDGYIARRFEIDGTGGPRPTLDVVTGLSLDEVRAKLPRGLVCFARLDGDAPSVVEVWL